MKTFLTICRQARKADAALGSTKYLTTEFIHKALTEKELQTYLEPEYMGDVLLEFDFSEEPGIQSKAVVKLLHD